MKKYGGLGIAIRYFKEADVITTSTENVNVNVQWLTEQERGEVFTNG